MLAGAGGKGGKGGNDNAAAAASTQGLVIEGGAASAAKRLNVALVEKRHGHVYDFEDHVADAQCDWFNFFLDDVLATEG